MESQKCKGNAPDCLSEKQFVVHEAAAGVVFDRFVVEPVVATAFRCNMVSVLDRQMGVLDRALEFCI